MRALNRSVPVFFVGVIVIGLIGVLLLPATPPPKNSRSSASGVSSSSPASQELLSRRPKTARNLEERVRLLSIDSLQSKKVATLLNLEQKRMTVAASGDRIFGTIEVLEVREDTVVLGEGVQRITLTLPAIKRALRYSPGSSHEEAAEGSTPIPISASAVDARITSRAAPRSTLRVPYAENAPRPGWEIVPNSPYLSTYAGQDVWRYLGGDAPRVEDRLSKSTNRSGLEEVEQYRFLGSEVEQLMPHLGLFVSDTRPRLAIEDGVIVGIELAEITEGSFFSHAGLQSGDIVIAIDGNAVLDPFDIVKFIDQNPTPTVLIEVLREGSHLKVELTCVKG
jgi:hypothetical protein